VQQPQQHVQGVAEQACVVAARLCRAAGLADLDLGQLQYQSQELVQVKW